MRRFFVSSSKDVLEHVIDWVLKNNLKYKVLVSGIIFDIPSEFEIEFMRRWNAYCSEVVE